MPQNSVRILLSPEKFQPEKLKQTKELQSVPSISSFFWCSTKDIYPKYSKHWPCTVAYTIDCVCSKMLNDGLNHGLFLSLFKLIPYHIHISYLNFKAVLAMPKTACSTQTHKSISFIWIVWSTLYVNLCALHKSLQIRALFKLIQLLIFFDKFSWNFMVNLK